jgi:hypothetical protein
MNAVAPLDQTDNLDLKDKPQEASAGEIFHAENGASPHSAPFSEPLQQVLGKGCDVVENCNGLENPQPDHLADIKSLNKTELRKKYPGEYSSWKHMKARCKESQAKGLSLKYAQDFEAFSDFLRIVGPKPFESATLDRIAPSKGYYPDNVRWANKETQGNNKGNVILVTYESETRTLTEWSNQLGIPYTTLKYRHSQGWSDQEIIEGKADVPAVPDFILELPWPSEKALEWEKHYANHSQPHESREHFMLRIASSKISGLKQWAGNYLSTIGLPSLESYEAKMEYESLYGVMTAEQWQAYQVQQEKALEHAIVTRNDGSTFQFREEWERWQAIQKTASDLILDKQRREAFIRREGGLGVKKERQIYDWLVSQGAELTFDPKKFPPPQNEESQGPWH